MPNVKVHSILVMRIKIAVAGLRYVANIYVLCHHLVHVGVQANIVKLIGIAAAKCTAQQTKPV